MAPGTARSGCLTLTPPPPPPLPRPQDLSRLGRDRWHLHMADVVSATNVPRAGGTTGNTVFNIGFARRLCAWMQQWHPLMAPIKAG